MSRNELCACGSGKRFKHCHGAEGGAVSTAPSALHLKALAAHQAWSLTRAEALYRQALAADPNDIESLHMLGVVQFERRRYPEALELLWDAAERTRWADAILRQNLGLLLAKLLTPDANARQEALVGAYVERKRTLRAMPPAAGRVSVVLPVCDAATTVARAIASVAAQTYADLELIVVDDGSTDATPGVVADALASLAFPGKLLRRGRRGIAQAGNDGAAAATGRYLAFLGADAWFAPGRVDRMVAELGRATPLWGFSQVTHVGGDGRPAAARPPGGPRVEPRDFLAHDPASFTLLDQDVMGPPENLFIDHDLFLRIGGYPAAPRGWGWAFGSRAARDVEPVPVAQHLYFQSGAAGSRTGAAERTERVNHALAGEAAATNEFCPQFAGNRDVLLRAELRAGRGDRLPVDMLRALAAQWRTRMSQPGLRRVPVAANSGTYQAAGVEADKAALVILGMYRSGTSAFARALNLCGAFLPARVSAAKLGLNPKGFWETEAVNDLDVRFMEVLGADWNRVGFELPGQGPLVDQFLTSSGELLATEYEDAPLILIKDPRICVLAPLWHRALRERGYRPAYVVVVRHPVEVAGSIETQGDIPLSEGLALWLTYMRRVEAFVKAGGIDVVHVGYPELLQDWRQVVRRIATTLAVPLDVDTHAGEVDRFLEAGMRTHEADDAALDASVDAATAEAIRALYERMLERRDQDAAAARER